LKKKARIATVDVINEFIAVAFYDGEI